MADHSIDIREGSIIGWIRSNPQRSSWSSSVSTRIAVLRAVEGSIELTISQEGSLRAVLALDGKGQKEIAYDLAHLDPGEPHQVGLVWSLKTREFKLILDGSVVVTTELVF